VTFSRLTKVWRVSETSDRLGNLRELTLIEERELAHTFTPKDSLEKVLVLRATLEHGLMQDGYLWFGHLQGYVTDCADTLFLPCNLYLAIKWGKDE